MNDLDRAENFYKAIFNFTFEKGIIDHYEVALLLFKQKQRQPKRLSLLFVWLLSARLCFFADHSLI